MPTAQNGKRNDAALSAKRQAFVANYLLDFNATQAAIRAGYSPRTAPITGHRLLKDANVITALASAREKREIKTNVTVADVVAMLEREAMAGNMDNPNNARYSRHIELLGKHQGMFTEKVQVEQTGPPPTINVRFGKPAADETPDATQQE